MVKALLIWLAVAYGKYAVARAAAKAGAWFLGQDVEKARRATMTALDFARASFHEKYGDRFGTRGNTFLDRDRNQRMLLRSTFPNEEAVAPEDIVPDGFEGAPKADREAVAFALETFDRALSETSSRELDRDRAQQATKQAAEQAAEHSAGARGAAEKAVDLILAEDDVRGALRSLLEQETPSTDILVKEGRLQEAERLLRERIEQIAELVEGASPSLKELVDRHITALRIMLGNVLAEAADIRDAQKQYEALGDPGELPSELRFGAAKLAFNVRDLNGLKTLRALHPEGSHQARQADLWIATVAQDWEEVINVLNTFDTDDGVRKQMRARALTELARKPAEASRLLGEAWVSTEKLRARLAVATTTADLVEGIVEREEKAPDIDRRALVRTATDRLRRVAGSAAKAPLLDAHAQLTLSAWFGFLGDREREASATKAFEKIELSEADRLRFVVDPSIEEDTLQQLTTEGVVDSATHHRVRALQLQAQRSTRREEAALWNAFDALPPGRVRTSLIERLLDIQLEIEDEPGAKAVVDELAADDPIRPLLAAKVDQEFRGDAVAQAALRNVLGERPRCRIALRSLFYLTARQAVEAEGERRRRLMSEALRYAERLYEVLPSRAYRMMVAEFYAELGCLSDAVDVCEEVAENNEVTVGLLRTKARLLVNADRLPEAARDLEDAYALDPSDVTLGSEAGRLWLEATRYGRAVETLERVSTDHEEEAAVHGNLGFARLFSADEQQRARALASFQKALRFAPEIKIGPFVLLEAAHAAGDPVAARQYAQQVSSEARKVEVASREDLEEIDQAVAEGESVQGQFPNRDSLHTFIEHHSSIAEALGNLSKSDMVPSRAVARRPWSSGLAAARRFQQHNQSSIAEAYATRAPWPSESTIQLSDSREAAKETSSSEGLLVGFTALLTLASLEAVEEVVRSAQQAYGRIVLYPGALSDLRDEIRSVASGLAWQDRQPYEGVLSIIDRNALGPHPEDPPPDDLASQVPEEAAEALGNSAPDVGLALRLEAGYVTLPTSYDTAEEREWRGRTWTSAEVLAALYEEGRVGRSQAEAIAGKALDTFAGWEKAEPPALTDFVVSGFVLVDWHTSGLLKLWVQRRAEWPTLRVGPFGVTHLRSQIDECAERQEVLGRMRDTLSTLDELTSEGAIEVLPEPTDGTNASGEDASPEVDFSAVWNYADGILEAADERGLQVWSDDRALGFMMWRYDMPISGPEVNEEVRHLREQYEGIDLFSTEMVLEQIEEQRPDRTTELGWKLLEIGYRPLLGRLALRHLLAEYSHNYEGPPYDRFLASVGALRTFLPPEDFVPPPKQEAYVNVAAVPVLCALLDVAWKTSGLDEQKRTDLADAILDACWEFFEEMPPLPLGKSFARVFVYLGMSREEEEVGLSPAEAWLGNALAERLSLSRQAAVTRAVEDVAIRLYREIRDRVEEEATEDEADGQRFGQAANRLSAQLAWPRFVPLLYTELLQAHAPAVRRLLGFLTGYSGPDDVTHTIRRGTPVPLKVEEEEIEKAALAAFWSASEDSELRDLLGVTRVQGTWKRDVPEDVPAADSSLPDSHPVEIDVPYLTLALRDEEDLREAVVVQLAHGLDLVDPQLRERVRELRTRLVADDESTRADAIEQLADAAVGSVALDLERGLSRAVDRLRARSLEDLEAWLINPARDPEFEDHQGMVAFEDGRRVPNSSFTAALIVALNESKAASALEAAAQDAMNEACDEGEAPNDALSILAERIEAEPNSFLAIYEILVFLYMLSRAPEAEVHHRETSLSAVEWVRETVRDIARGGKAVEAARHPHRAYAHAYVLRLAVHACSGPTALEELFERVDEDTEDLASEWASSVLIASDRLMSFVADRHSNPHDAVHVLLTACEHLGFQLDQPGHTSDRLNPMLYGPELVNHERWFLLHALNVTWDGLAGSDGGEPMWWSEGVRKALAEMVENPEPHEDLLISEEDQNGLGMTISQAPSEIAQNLIERAA